jgi:predicted HAD superfamily phosphohydrolase
MSGRLGETDRTYQPAVRTGLPSKPAIDRVPLVHLTDFEGPVGKGDGAFKVAEERIGPEPLSHHTNYGAILYREEHEAFMDSVINDETGRRGQVGHDVIFPLPALLYGGVTNEDIVRIVVDIFDRTPGSPEHIAYLKGKQAYTIGITTGYEQAHSKIALEDVGLDDLIATDFPIDRVREDLYKSGRWTTEMTMTGNWLRDCYALISKREKSGNDRERASLTRKLRLRIMNFFTEELGLTWNKEGEMAPYQGKFRTELGKSMAGLYVVGDQEKANAVRLISSWDLLQPGSPPPIFVADGINDTLGLKAADWSIGLNGADAAEAAKIGVAALNIGPVLIALTNAILRHPQATPANVEAVINEAREDIHDPTVLIHKGGNDARQHSGRHIEVKTQIRGANGALVDNLRLHRID